MTTTETDRARRGVRTRTTTTGRIVFVCPRCEVDRTGELRRRRRWLGIGSLSLLPLEVIDEGIGCTVCGATAGLDALQVPTSDQLGQQLAVAYRHALATVIRADSMTTVERRIARVAFRAMHTIGFAYDEAMLVQDLLTTSDTDTSARLHGLVETLSPQGKQGFLHRMAVVALADGPLSGAERLALTRIGISLGMASANIHGVIAVACAQYEAA